MARKATKLNQAEFEALLLSWADTVIRKVEEAEYGPESEKLKVERLAEEARDLTRYGVMYVWEMRIHNALMACVELNNVIIKDLSKVQFDWENCGCDLERDTPTGFWTTSSGVPMLGCYAGGDWEDSVFFVLYPESATSIRAYMPKAGNTWNLKNKTAWGSGDDEEEEDADENPRKVDVAAFRADVEARIQAK
jgi:hypothetical protein